jgi:hypothetical protein
MSVECKSKHYTVKSDMLTGQTEKTLVGAAVLGPPERPTLSIVMMAREAWGCTQHSSLKITHRSQRSSQCL